MAAAPQRPGTAPQKAPAPTYLLPPDFAEFAPSAGYQAESDGRVYTVKNGQKSYVPPWIVWQTSMVGKDPDTGQLTDEGRSYRTPGSDPSSAWRFMYESSGPFRKGSQWDDKEGTYKGSVDWGTLLGTIAAGGIIAGGVAASVGGGSAAGGGGVGSISGTTPVLEGVAAGPGAASTAAGLGAAPLAGEAGVTAGVSAGLPGAVAAPALASSTIAPTVGALAPTVAPSGAAATGGTVAASAGPGILSKTLSALTTPAVLSTISQGAFGVWGAGKAADAQTDAAKIVADANTAAAKIQADAATQAAQIQAKSTAEALAFAKQGYADQSARYEQNQEQLSPYTGAGGAAVTKLSQLFGLGTPPPYVSAVKPQAAPAAPQTGVQSMARPGTAAQQASADAFVPNAVQSNPALSAVPQGPGPNAGSISSLAPSQPQMVTLRAPTGEVTQKPASEVQHWVSLGAQPVQQGAGA